MAGISLLRQLVLLLCLSHLIYSNALPITRISNLQQKFHGFEVSADGNTENVGKAGWNLKTNSERRMDIQLNDYPGSGANNRHNPGKG